MNIVSNFFRKIYLVIFCREPIYNSIKKETSFLFLNAFWDTCKITFSSCFCAFFAGLSLGVYLYLLRLNNNKKKYFFFNGIINVFISIPYLLLVILIISLFLGPYFEIYYGFKAGLICLTLILTIIFARNCEQLFLQLNQELYKTAYTLGANKKQFVILFLLKEARSPLILKLNSLFISSLAYSNVLPMIGVNGIFSITYNYGYQAQFNLDNQEINNIDLIWVPTLLIFLLVQIINLIFNYIAKKLDKN
ncbi:ABC transporter permease subunit [Candidatus Phytoplasma pini]|uniref:D-methionine transport system permease protein metI n=1 Tax=Candidatus Phytoplasma pini TaxID=267362 RepID=A0A559KJ44_9MOLU|nr:ABC transporter permease subunit [Candidatus Phytoplasma pini]TVY12129.1 D-methionine transport system permease protein metI [Candidatus Phytoplasma pini]